MDTLKFYDAYYFFLKCSHAGTLECQAILPDILQDTVSQDLNIIPRPRVQIHPLLVTSYENSQVLMKCTILQTAQEGTIKWYKNGEFVDQTGNNATLIFCV